MLPDLAARIAFWQDKLRIRDWKIAARYVDDLQTADGAPAYALCQTFPDDARATLAVCTPRSAEDVARVEEAIVHELLHVLLAPLAGHNVEPASIHAEERAVWTLAPLLAAGGREADMIARAMRAPRYARVAARAQRAAARAARRYAVDNEQIKGAIEALKAGDGNKALEILEAMLMSAVAAQTQTEPPPSEPMTMADPANTDEKDKPPMGMTEQKDPMYQRQPQRAAEQVLDAKIERLIDARVRAALQPVAGKIDATAAAVEAQQRDQLLAAHGHKLPEGQLRWARTQSLKTVQGLLSATPDAEAPAGQSQQRAARAVQGGKQEPGGRRKLAPHERDPELDRRMGISVDPIGPSHDRRGRFTLNPTTPTDFRRAMRAGFETVNGGRRGEG